MVGGRAIVAQPETAELFWRPQGSTQWWFLAAPHFEALFHGSRGPGKTDALLMDFAQEVGRGHGSAWRGILFRQSYPQLEEVRTKARRWFPDLFAAARWNGGQSKWTFAGGEELLLRHMSRPDDYVLIYGGKEQDRVEIGFRQPNGLEAHYSAGGVSAVDGQRVRAEVEAVVAAEAASIAPELVDRLVSAACRAAGVTC